MTTIAPQSSIKATPRSSMAKSSFESSAGFKLVDVLVLLAEHARSLVLVMLLAGLAGLAYRWILPGGYESVTIVRGVTSAAPTLLMSPGLLTPVIRELGLDKGRTLDDAVDDLRGRIKVAFSAREQIATISVYAPTPEGAQKLGQLVFRQLAFASAPSGSERARLEAQLADVKTRTTQVTEGIALIRARLADNSRQGTSDLVQGYSHLIQTARNLSTESATLEKQLLGLDESSLLQPPTLPGRPRGSGFWIVGLIAAGVGGIGYVFLLVMRRWVSSVFGDDESVAKLRRARQSLRSF